MCSCVVRGRFRTHEVLTNHGRVFVTKNEMQVLQQMTRYLYRPLSQVSSSFCLTVHPRSDASQAQNNNLSRRIVCSASSLPLCHRHEKFRNHRTVRHLEDLYGHSRESFSSSSSPEPEVWKVIDSNQFPNRNPTSIPPEVLYQNDITAAQKDNSLATNQINKDDVSISPEPVLSWKSNDNQNLPDYITYYLRLSKFRLTSLVVATTLAGFTMGCPGWSMDPALLTATLIGTGLTSASAASLNQFLEIPFDSQMSRTRSRPLVVGQLTPFHAFNFAVVTGALGLSILFLGVNTLTGILGVTNLALYSFIYTPLKRMNIINTWIGSFVGAIPPVMGFTAATGMIDLSGLLLGAILYSWQFPHFNALSWNLRHDYARAGYRMMSVTDPQLCLRTQMRHSLYLTSYCLLMSHPSIGLTTWAFAADTLPFNLYLVYLSYKFKKDPGSASSRKLFRYSLIHLPAIILLMIISKNAKSEKTSQRIPKDNLLE